MPEAWMPVPGYEGLYEVSDAGLVRSVPRLITHRDGQQRRLRGVALRTRIDRDGYPQITLWSEGVGRTFKIHRLVLLAFVGKPNRGDVCLHGNGIPTDNTVANLSWGTQSENCLDAVTHGTHGSARKTHCPQGHPYSGDNLSTRPNGDRRCRACHRDQQRAYRRLAAHEERDQS